MKGVGFRGFGWYRLLTAASGSAAGRFGLELGSQVNRGCHFLSSYFQFLVEVGGYVPCKFLPS